MIIIIIKIRKYHLDKYFFVGNKKYQKRKVIITFAINHHKPGIHKGKQWRHLKVIMLRLYDISSIKLLKGQNSCQGLLSPRKVSSYKVLTVGL